MTDTAIEQLLQQHFSIDALQQAPAPLQQALRMLGGWLAAERGEPYPHTPYAELLTHLSDTRPPEHGMPVTAFLQELDTPCWPIRPS